MNSSIAINTITGLVGALLEEDPDYFLVEVKINPTNNVKVFLDADNGVSLDRCVKYNRALYKQIEENGIFGKDNFSLEVSSAGLDEPLKLKRQYAKNVGRDVEIVMQSGDRLKGRLISVAEASIQVAEEIKGKDKKKDVIEHTLTFDNIKSTKIQIQF